MTDAALDLLARIAGEPGALKELVDAQYLDVDYESPNVGTVTTAGLAALQNRPSQPMTIGAKVPAPALVAVPSTQVPEPPAVQHTKLDHTEHDQRGINLLVGLAQKHWTHDYVGAEFVIVLHNHPVGTRTLHGFSALNQENAAIIKWIVRDQFRAMADDPGEPIPQEPQR